MFVIPQKSHIELPGGLSRIEHYGKDFGEKYNWGLVKSHCFINDYTQLSSYCLDNYEEIKDIKYCNTTCKNFNDKYTRGNDRFIEAFQVFKVLIDRVDKLITPMELTGEVLTTQFHDNVNDFKTLEYN